MIAISRSLSVPAFLENSTGHNIFLRVGLDFSGNMIIF